MQQAVVQILFLHRHTHEIADGFQHGEIPHIVRCRIIHTDKSDAFIILNDRRKRNAVYILYVQHLIGLWKAFLYTFHIRYGNIFPLLDKILPDCEQLNIHILTEFHG